MKLNTDVEFNATTLANSCLLLTSITTPLRLNGFTANK